MRKGEPDIANNYIDSLKNRFPESQWTTLLTDPNFQENSKFGVHLEDSIYAATYEAFKADRYNEVAGNVQISTTRFPLGANRDKFLFIGGLSKLNSGNAEECVKDMKEIVEKFPQSRISEMAGMIVNGVKAGRRLRGGKFDLGNVWNRRTDVLNDSDSIRNVQFSKERDVDFHVMLVYNPDSLNENKLLFEMAKFNFTHFVVRNFDIEIVDDAGLHRMQLSGFRSFDEAIQYARELGRTKSVLQQMNKNTRIIVISDKNLQILGVQLSYNDYEKFYEKNFSPIQVTKRYLLSEPAEIATPRERDLKEEIESKAPTMEDINDEQQKEEQAEDGFTVPIEEPTPAVDSTKTKQTVTGDAFTLPDNSNSPSDSTKVAPAENGAADNEFTIPDEKVTEQGQDDNSFTLPADDNNSTKQPEKEAKTIEPKKEEDKGATENKASTAIKADAEKPTENKKQPATTEPEKTAENKQAVKAEAGKTVENKKQAQTTEPEKPVNDDEPTIIFDDDDSIPPTNNNKKPTDDSIEDEYYDLDGF